MMSIKKREQKIIVISQETRNQELSESLRAKIRSILSFINQVKGKVKTFNNKIKFFLNNTQFLFLIKTQKIVLDFFP